MMKNRKMSVMKMMMMKAMMHLKIKTTWNPYIHTPHIYWLFSFSCQIFFHCVWRSTSLLLSLLTSYWCTISSSVTWLFDRRSFSCVCLHHCCVLFSLYFTVFSLFISDPVVVMYVSPFRVCMSYSTKEKTLCLSC